MSKTELYDTTLRDGAQTWGITFSLDDKNRIAQKLVELGIDLIEGGYPGSNPKDRRFFQAAKDMHFMRDPTRGGLATTLKEAALESGLCIKVREDVLPIPPQVKGACGLLGLDPLYAANEGILVAILKRADADAVLTVMKKHPYGQSAVIIGDVTAAPAGMVLLETAIGGSRILDMLAGEQLPRIC